MISLKTKAKLARIAGVSLAAVVVLGSVYLTGHHAGSSKYKLQMQELTQERNKEREAWNLTLEFVQQRAKKDTEQAKQREQQATDRHEQLLEDYRGRAGNNVNSSCSCGLSRDAVDVLRQGARK